MDIANSADLDKWLFDHAQTQKHPCTSIKGLVRGERCNIAWVDTKTGERIDVIYYDPDDLETWDGNEDHPGYGDIPFFLHHHDCPSFCEYACNPQGFEQATMIAQSRSRQLKEGN